MIRLFISLVFVFGSLLSFAQGGSRVGIKTGYNFTRLHNSNFVSDTAIGHFPNAAFNIGAVFGWNAKYYNFGLTLGLYYKEYKQTFQYVPKGGVFSEWKNTYKLRYFEVPLLFRLRDPGDQKTRSFSYGGPYFEIGFSGAMLMSATQTDIDTMLPFPIAGSDISSRFERFLLNGVIGVGGHQVGLEHISVTHGIRLTFSLLDIGLKANRGVDHTNVDGSTSPYKSFRLISAGYVFTVAYKF